MREEYKKASLPDFEDPDFRQYKEDQEKFVSNLKDREKQKKRKLDVGLTRQTHKAPLRLLYNPDEVSMGKLAPWLVQAMGCMTLDEFEDFYERNEANLSLNERQAAHLVYAASVTHDKAAEDRWWSIQDKLFNAALKHEAEPEKKAAAPSDSLMQGIFSAIEEGIAKKTSSEAKEAEVVEGSN